MEKRCRRCGESKARAEFYVNRAARDRMDCYCIVCRKEYVKAWAQKNRQRSNAWHLAWKKAHPEIGRRHAREYKQRHREQELERGRARHRRELATEEGRLRNRQQVRAWQIANPDKVRAHSRVRRGRKIGATGTHTAEQVAARIAFWGEKCWMCGGPWNQIDHVIPLVLNGSNWPANLRPICKPCNLKKGAKHPLRAA